MKKQRPQNDYRCLSKNSSERSYHLLLGGDSMDGSSHSRDFQEPVAVDYSMDSVNSPSNADNGLRRRGFSSAAANYPVSARI
ncbi:hypothetical protein CDL12_17221 [Handroanthus impetiginosus]|uniref:Uncharacterized protein n=1 Tax=Handroanthus impetiginosus TaxID=429701 RepID=A0A2G9GY32_9LAMI|nr:hypothetical protein CDL12_17221 [Handroanthus impetiginosus]